MITLGKQSLKEVFVVTILAVSGSEMPRLLLAFRSFATSVTYIILFFVTDKEYLLTCPSGATSTKLNFLRDHL